MVRYYLEVAVAGVDLVSADDRRGQGRGCGG